jgi:outer membrane protein OmpA-like peptidoglycan-associated protein
MAAFSFPLRRPEIGRIRDMMMTQNRSLSIAALCAATLLLGGCATKKFVNDGMTAQDAKMADIETQVEANQRRLSEAGEKIDSVDGKATEAQRLGKDAGTAAKQADSKANEALEMARGKLLYKVVLSDVASQFGLNKSEIADEARAKLDELATRLKNENGNVYLEIEGHTDSSGDEEYNLVLGNRRAEAVRRYLNMQHGIPLHRMSVISYGESRPLADNGTREGRSQNRRVEVKVLS